MKSVKNANDKVAMFKSVLKTSKKINGEIAFLKDAMKRVKHAKDQICAGYVDPDFDLRRHRAGVVLRTNGSAFSFGDPKTFGDSSGIDLTNIKQILCPRFTCVAVKADGSIVP